MGETALGVIDIRAAYGGWYDFNAKYSKGGSIHILPADLKKTLNELVSGGQLPNLMFSGTAGLGKTTAAKALCNMLDLDYILINGSEERGIDVLRNKIKQFASTVSLTGGYKVVILD